MDATEKYYRDWIQKIAKRTSPLSIKRHIIHHATEITGPAHNRKAWLASMYNLIRIYEEVYGVHSSTPEKLYRLENRYHEKKRATPPPGGKIPAHVKITSNPAFDDSSVFKNQDVVKELRRSGRR